MPKELEERQGSALAMEVGRDAKRQVATKVLRAKQPSAKHMVEERDASTWGAQRAPRAKQITVYLTEVEEGVAFLRDALRLHVASQGYA